MHPTEGPEPIVSKQLDAGSRATRLRLPGRPDLASIIRGPDPVTFTFQA